MRTGGKIRAEPLGESLPLAAGWHPAEKCGYNQEKREHRKNKVERYLRGAVKSLVFVTTHDNALQKADQALATLCSTNSGGVCS